MRVSCTIILFCGWAAATAAPGSGHGFIENKGQLRDQHGRAAEHVRLLWPTGRGVNVQVLDDGIRYDTYTLADGRARFHRMDLRFVGASPMARVEAEAPMEGRLHFVGRDGRQVRDAREFRAARIRDVYPGVDVHLRIDDTGGLKYDLVLRDGADLGRVRMRYSGFDGAEPGTDAVVFTVSGRTITERIPASWQGPRNQPVRIGYQVVGQRSGELELGLRRISRADGPLRGLLTVDPAVHFDWGTWFGGEGDDAVNAVDVDGVAMSYTTGRTAGLLTTVTAGPHQSEFAGGDADAFLMKVAPHGSRLFVTYFGGEGDDEGLGIDVDDYYRVRVVGRTTSLTGILADSTSQGWNAGGEDAFVARFDSTGHLVWSTCLGGSGDDRALAVRAMAEGNAIVCGVTLSPDLFDSLGIAPVQAYADSVDAFALWINDQGEVLKGTFLGGEGDDALVAVALFPNSTAYLAGHTRSTTGISDSTALGGPRDGWICAVDTGLAVLWSRYVGGTGDDAVCGIARRDSDLVACGHASEPEVPDSAAAPINGATDLMILRVGQAGDLDTLFLVGGPGIEHAVSVQSNSTGLYFVAVTAYGVVYPTYDPDLGAWDTLQMGAQAQVLCFLPNDSLIDARSIGGDADDVALAMAAYRSSAITVAGSTRSDWGIGSDGFQMSAPGQEDGFLARFITDFSAPCNGIGPPGGGCSPGGCAEWSSDWCGGTPPPFPHIYLCRGDTFTLCAQGGFLPFGHYWFWYADECGDPQRFLHLGGCITFVVQEAFRLWVRVEGPMSTSSCTGLDIRVEDYPVPLALAPAFVCHGDSVPLSGSGGHHHEWEGPQGFTAADAEAAASTEGLLGEAPFILTAFSEHGCAAQDTAVVDVVAVPAIAYAVTHATCHGGSDGAIAADSLSAALFAFTYPQQGASGPLLDALAAGAYIAVATDTLGCFRTDTLLVQEPAHPLDTVMVQNATCGQSNGALSAVLIPGAGDFTFTWLPDSLQGASIQGLPPGAYQLQLSNDLGCLYTAYAALSDTGSIIAWAVPDSVEVLFGDSVALAAYHAPYDAQASVAWTPDDGLSCADCAAPMASPLSTTLYTVTITSSLGCTSAASVRITVLPLPVPQLFLPTHFSPNGDGLNDSFGALGGTFVRMRLSIADRDGLEVFSGEGERPAWDGAIRGAPARTGVYRYTLIGEHADGSSEQVQGHITLIR